MSDKPENPSGEPTPSGGWRIVNTVLPAIDLDYADEKYMPSPDIPVGEFRITNTVLPAINLPPLEEPIPWLTVTIQLPAKIDPSGAARELADFLGLLNDLERSLGGLGLDWDRGASSGAEGSLTLVIRPRQVTGSRTRFEQLIAACEEALKLESAQGESSPGSDGANLIDFDDVERIVADRNSISDESLDPDRFGKKLLKSRQTFCRMEFQLDPAVN